MLKNKNRISFSDFEILRNLNQLWNTQYYLSVINLITCQICKQIRHGIIDPSCKLNIYYINDNINNNDDTFNKEKVCISCRLTKAGIVKSLSNPNDKNIYVCPFCFRNGYDLRAINGKNGHCIMHHEKKNIVYYDICMYNNKLL